MKEIINSIGINTNGAIYWYAAFAALQHRNFEFVAVSADNNFTFGAHLILLMLNKCRMLWFRGS